MSVDSQNTDSSPKVMARLSYVFKQRQEKESVVCAKSRAFLPSEWGCCRRNKLLGSWLTETEIHKVGKKGKQRKRDDGVFECFWGGGCRARGGEGGVGEEKEILPVAARTARHDDPSHACKSYYEPKLNVDKIPRRSKLGVLNMSGII